MRDGARLAAMIYRPAAEGRFPVLLARTPYGRANTQPDFAIKAAQSGYVVIVQDVRGTGESQGQCRPMLDEVEDGYDTLEWVCSLDYTLPEIGMFGGSYLGFTQFAAAASHHPALKAISPRVCTTRPRDMWDLGRGAFPLQAWMSWFSGVVHLPDALKLSGEEKAAYLAFYADLQDGFSSGDSYHKLPLKDIPYLGDGGINPAARDVVERFDDQEQLQRLYSTDWETDIPSLYIGGWHDPLTRSYMARTTIGKHSGGRHRVIIGPWDHLADSQVVGDLDFGRQANPFALALNNILLRWFDISLKEPGRWGDVDQAVKLFEMGTNRFVYFNSWPPEGTQHNVVFLDQREAGSNASAGGRLNQNLPSAPGCFSFDYDPRNPVPTTGGVLLPQSLVQTGPRDQRPIEAREDVLVFSTEPLQDPVTVIGAVKVVLWVSTSAADSDFSVKLVDVHPDGRAFNVLQTLTRLRYRNGDGSFANVRPGERIECELDLGATYCTFLKGHMIRLDVSSSDFPYIARNLNCGEPMLFAEESIVAHQCVYSGGDCPSRIEFDVIMRA